MLRPIAVLASFAASAVTAAAPSYAEWTPVPGRILKELVAGSTVVIDAPMGFKLPVRHGEDGALEGDAGGLAFYLGSSTDTGRWWVERDRLCYRWARWFKSEARCMKIRRAGTRIEWEKDDGETGTGTVTVAGRGASPREPAGERVASVRTPSRATAPSPVEGTTAPVTEQIPVAPAAPSAARASLAPRRAPDPAAPQLAEIKPPSTPQPPQASATPSASPRRVAVAALTAPKPPYRIGGPPEPAYRVVSVADDDVLNVRQGPSADHAAIAALDPDARGVRILGPCRSEWCFVRHKDIVGWVNRTYLEAMAQIAPQPRAPAER